MMNMNSTEVSTFCWTTKREQVMQQSLTCVEIYADVYDFDGHAYRSIYLLAGGVPYLLFSVADEWFYKDDERDLLLEAIWFIEEIKLRVVMLENVHMFLKYGFDEYREHIFSKINKLGYITCIKLLNASNFGVS